MTERYALAAGKVYLGPAAYELVKQNKMKKGDVLTVAQLAGASASRLSYIIPVECGQHQMHRSCYHADQRTSTDTCAMLVGGVQQEALHAVTHLEADLENESIL